MTKTEIGRKSWRQRLLLSADSLIGWFLHFQLIHHILQRIFLVLAWCWAAWTFKIRNRLRIIGRENLPHSAQVLYLSNHLTLIDSFLIGFTVIGFWEAVFFPSHIPWNAPDAKNYLSRPLWRHVFWLLKNIPVERHSSGIGTIKGMLSRFKSALQSSTLVLFFEGTRSRNGDIGDCVDGVCYTIDDAKPKRIVPILLHGVNRVMPIQSDRSKDFSWSNIRSGQEVHVVIGPPIDFGDIQQTNGDLPARTKRQLIGQRVREAVVKLRDRLPAGIAQPC